MPTETDILFIFFTLGACPRQRSTFSKAITQTTRFSFVCYHPIMDYGKAGKTTVNLV